MSAWKTVCGIGLLAVVPALTASGCGGDDTTASPPPKDEPRAEVDVTVQLPEKAVVSTVSSLHLWLIVPEKDSEVTCGTLVGGSVKPYAVDARTVADVGTQDPKAHLLAKSVPPGNALAYVEANDFGGKAEYAGCVEVKIVVPSTSAVVTLGKAEVFDCAAPDTEEGAPCDDGKLCTVGETCHSGQCGEASARDCTHVADSCNAESCDEQLGCVPVPLADDTPCDDDLYCTTGDVCTAGKCGGVERDCDTGLGECEVSLGCNEQTEQCEVAEAPNNTPCDDGYFCTDNDYCYFGFCEGGTSHDCSSLDTPCQQGVCDDSASACVPQYYSSFTSCNDGLFCTTSDHCDGMGACTGTPMVCAGGTSCAPKVCDENLNACMTQNAMSGTACDDLNACTSGDQCNGLGVCSGTVIPMCP